MSKKERVVFVAQRDEEGSALIIALVTLTVLGIYLAAVLSLTDANFKTTLAVRAQGNVVYSSDGATDGTIGNMRSNGAIGGIPPYGGDCNFLAFPSTNSHSPDVACTALAGSGVPAGGDPSTGANTPKNAILTMQTATASSGLNNNGNKDLAVRGPIYSNNQIHTGPGWIKIGNRSPVTAVAGCTTSGGAKIQNTYPDGTVHDICNTSGSDGSDPGYGIRSDALSPTPPTWQDVSKMACPAAGVNIFSPGFYDDAGALSAKLGCGSKVNWFQPGVYFFDFSNSGSHVLAPGNGVKIIGGEALGWNPTTPTYPSVNSDGKYVRACKDDNEGPGPGVQLIFGGDSALTLGNGNQLQLCARRSPTEQQIALYGLTNNLSLGAQTVERRAIQATSGDFSNPANAQAIGETPTALLSTFSPSGGGFKNGTINLNYSAGLPSGSTVTAVRVRVVHQESSVDTAKVKSIKATLTSGDGASTVCFSSDTSCSGARLNLNTSLSSEVFTLPAAFNSLAKLNGLQVAYQASVKQPDSATIDGISIQIDTTPIFRAETQGVTTVLNAPNGQPSVMIRGTMYIPRASAVLFVTNNGLSVINRGIIAWTLQMQFNPSNGYSGDYISIPDYGAGGLLDNREVTLVASISGVNKLRARVKFYDCSVDNCSTPGAIQQFGRKVEVKEWEVLR